jgi:hypothetical protein
MSWLNLFHSGPSIERGVILENTHSRIIRILPLYTDITVTYEYYRSYYFDRIIPFSANSILTAPTPERNFQEFPNAIEKHLLLSGRSIVVSINTRRNMS